MMGPSCSSTACPLDEGEVDSDSAGVDGVFGECIGEIETSIPLGWCTGAQGDGDAGVPANMKALPLTGWRRAT
jgi:hypothetical protein